MQTSLTVTVWAHLLRASHTFFFFSFFWDIISLFLQEVPFCGRLSLLSTEGRLEEASLEACHCCSWISPDRDASWDMCEAHLPRKIAAHQPALRRLCMQKDWFSSFWDYHSMEVSEIREDKYRVTLNRGKKALWNYLLAPCFPRFCISGNEVTVCWHSLMCNDIIPGVWRQQEAQNQTYLSFHRKRRD